MKQQLLRDACGQENEYMRRYYLDLYLMYLKLQRQISQPIKKNEDYFKYYTVDVPGIVPESAAVQWPTLIKDMIKQDLVPAAASWSIDGIEPSKGFNPKSYRSFLFEKSAQHTHAVVYPSSETLKKLEGLSPQEKRVALAELLIYVERQSPHYRLEVHQVGKLSDKKVLKKTPALLNFLWAYRDQNISSQPLNN